MLELILGFVLGILASYLFAILTLRRFVKKILASDTTVGSLDDLTIRARVEEHNGVFYFYNNDSDEFLVQGSNLQELIDHIEARKPGAVVHVVNGDESTIAQLKALAK